VVTRYVSERELVFSPDVLGFPSIMGCHGIVYVTNAGLFGYHNYGGEIPGQYNDRATAFANFVAGHPNGPGVGSALFGACYLTQAGDTLRAYGANPRQKWIAELTAFASALGFNGPIYGYDFGTFPGIGASAYSEFQRVNATCVVQVKTWTNVGATSAPNTDHVNIRYNPRLSVLEDQARNTINLVPATGMRTVYPQQLR